MFFWSAVKKNIAYTYYVSEHLRYCTQISEYWLNKNASLNIAALHSLWMTVKSEWIFLASQIVSYFVANLIGIWQKGKSKFLLTLLSAIGIHILKN